MKTLIASVLYCLLATPAFAAESNPVVYSLGSITIVPTESVDAKTETDSEATPPPERVPHRFDTDIKSIDILNADGMFLQDDLGPAQAVLYLYAEPVEQAQLGYANIFSKRDILAVGPDGSILAIIPNITPSEMFEPVLVKAKTRALLHVKAGICEIYDIRPKDRVEHELFSKRPVVLQ